MTGAERAGRTRPYIIQNEGGKEYKVWKVHTAFRAWSAKQRVVNLLEDIVEYARFQGRGTAADFIAETTRRYKKERASLDEQIGITTPVNFEEER